VLFFRQDPEVAWVIVVWVPVFMMDLESVNTTLLAGLVRLRTPSPDDLFLFLLAEQAHSVSPFCCQLLLNGDHPYSRINDYTEQAVYTIASEVIVATIRKSEDAVGDVRCGFPINTNFTLLHLTGKYKEEG